MPLSRFAFEHELSHKTKGNSQREMPSRAETLRAAPKVLAESTRKLLEIEYGYAKDNCTLAINQRSEMMRVYLAIIGILTGAGFALVREGRVSDIDLDVIFGMALFACISSIYYMRGLIILRSDWRDYLEVMARAKIAFLSLEDSGVREWVMERALYHDPFRLPSKNLKTNFFYHSFILCVLSLISAAIVCIFVVFYAMFPRLFSSIQTGFSLGSILVAFAIAASISVWMSGRIWDTVLAEERESGPPATDTD